MGLFEFQSILRDQRFFFFHFAFLSFFRDPKTATLWERQGLQRNTQSHYFLPRISSVHTNLHLHLTESFHNYLSHISTTLMHVSSWIRSTGWTNRTTLDNNFHHSNHQAPNLPTEISTKYTKNKSRFLSWLRHLARFLAPYRTLRPLRRPALYPSGAPIPRL